MNRGRVTLMIDFSIVPLNGQCRLKIVYVCNEKEACICITLSINPIDFAYRCYRVRTRDFADRMALIKRTEF